MCGICGELNFKNAASTEAVNAMMAKLEKRGPDFGDIWHHDHIAFGHRRLAIIDLTEHSNQPMVDYLLGVIIVFNGVIYNYPELRQQFIKEGYEFESEGDTEVILKAYHKWGEDCPKYLSGMFAFAIWDEKKRRIFAARDRMGIKPFYFSLTNEHFRFASNMQALLATGEIDKSIDRFALHNQFSLHAVIPAPRTIVNGIRKLEPATSMTIDMSGKQEIRRYWSLDSTRPEKMLSAEEWTEIMHDALREAVRNYLDVADVQVGVLLSGGLDSSLLVALLAETGIKDLLTISIGFEDHLNEKGSEFEFSDQVADLYKSTHHRYFVSNDDVLLSLPDTIKNMSEPMVGQDCVAFYLLAEKVSRELKVVISGQGADEVFAGYSWFPQMYQDKTGSELSRFERYYLDRSHDEFLEMVAPEYRGENFTSQILAELLGQANADEFIDRVLCLDITTLMIDDPVKRVDNMMAAWGVETRVPFLDDKVVELAAKMPPEMKLGLESGLGGKDVIKRISRGLIPDAIIDRPKGYFPVPALKYVHGEFLDFMRDVLDSQACKNRGIFMRSYVDTLLSEPDKHFTKLQGSKLWHLALLELWFQTHLDS